MLWRMRTAGMENKALNAHTSACVLASAKQPLLGAVLFFQVRDESVGTGDGMKACNVFINLYLQLGLLFLH